MNLSNEGNRYLMRIIGLYNIAINKLNIAHHPNL